MNVKSIFNILAAGVLVVSMASCSGSSSKDDGEKNDKDTTNYKFNPQAKANADENAGEAVEVDLSTLGQKDSDGVIEVTDDNAFVTYVSEGERTRPIVIDCGATWCGPCQQFKPTFHKVAKNYADEVDFYYVDIDNNPNFANTFGISAVPTLFVVLPDGRSTSSTGLLSEEDFEELVVSWL